MPVTLTIENVPDETVARLKAQAKGHRRSLQGELLAIIEQAVGQPRHLTPGELLAEVRLLGLRTPSESAAMIRADRDG